MITYEGFVIQSIEADSYYTIITEYHGIISCKSYNFKKKYHGLKNNFFITYEYNNGFNLLEPSLLNNEKQLKKYPHLIACSNLLLADSLYKGISTKDIFHLYNDFIMQIIEPLDFLNAIFNIATGYETIQSKKIELNKDNFNSIIYVHYPYNHKIINNLIQMFFLYEI